MYDWVNYLITASRKGRLTYSLSRLLLFRGPVLKMHSRFDTEQLMEAGWSASLRKCSRRSHGGFYRLQMSNVLPGVHFTFAARQASQAYEIRGFVAEDGLDGCSF